MPQSLQGVLSATEGVCDRRYPLSLHFFFSSLIPAELLPTDFVLEPEYPSFSKTSLRFRSVFRCHKLALLHKSLVLRVLGELDNELMEEINLKLQLALGLSEISTY